MSINNQDMLTIGQLAKQVDVSNDTVRMYEKDGLMDKPHRADNGYRLYPVSAVKQLKFIKRAKALGFTLKEIKDLLVIQRMKGNTNVEMREQAKQKLDLIEQRISDLRHFQLALQTLINQCEKQDGDGKCPIVNFLYEDSSD